MPISPKRKENNLVSKGDILIVRSNGSRDLVGKNCIVQELRKETAFASYLIRIRPVLVESEYIYILLNSNIVRDQFFSHAKSSAGINNINTVQLSNTVITLPPFEEQKEIVRQVEQLFSFADKLEMHFQEAKNKLDKLPQSVLAKAFRGELVTTEAELARKQGRDYESGQQLLERIKIEKLRLEQELKNTDSRSDKNKKRNHEVH